jgi:DNA-binding response OmpR family regulator
VRIGLLEDNPAILDYMETALNLAGHEVFSHIQSESLLQVLLTAVQMRSSLPYDIVVIDILLPGEASGADTIAELRRWLHPEDLPIIVVSACSQEKLELIQELFPDILTLRKPFKTSALLSLIEQNQR